MQNVVLMNQVHGNNVVLVTENDLGKTIKDCDGLITNSPQVLLRISVADCLPIFISDSTSNAIGIVHAGWRGLDNQIIKMAIKKMKNKWKVKTGKLKIFIGPHICVNHYEVKTDVSDKFSAYPKCILRINGKIYLDLAAVACEQLIELGVVNANIKIDSACTFETKELHSFRRGDKKGRNTYVFGVNSLD